MQWLQNLHLRVAEPRKGVWRRTKIQLYYRYYNTVFTMATEGTKATTTAAPVANNR